MSFLAEEQIEVEAQKLRTKLGLDQQDNPDMMTVIVKLKHLGLIKDYRRVADQEMPEDLAAFYPEEGLLLIRESTFSAMNRNDPRARFTIAHELGHMWLKHPKARHRNVSGRAIEKIAPTIKRDEFQANRFAGAFLAPANRAGHGMSPAKLAERFMLSSSAAETRKKELEKLHRQKHGILRPLPEGFANFLQELKSRNPRS